MSVQPKHAHVSSIQRETASSLSNTVRKDFAFDISRLGSRADLTIVKDRLQVELPADLTPNVISTLKPTTTAGF